ncbi:hypothetical protein G7Y89_g7970 [Cudoniella acicularis]|uniref:Class E vacuolar protein-sorting machinery protein HSE1 n=1 Tax=Cudoniella acicularis TaxID=354080 RepID=A0A8H4RHE9_9HELO|nr:hypothetical protein G7Y89_g7970 [Cudoniella acicularis]
MFRAQQNAFDDVVAKATDENLTSENWEYIMDVCDKVTTEESGAKDAVASMIKRLAHRNANVQLYTLELANALSQNCGPKMHRELASRAFTDALLRLANDRNTHQQVKAKILERMQEWAEMFKDPDLGIMRDQYQRLKSQNPNLHPPSAPSKSRLTDLDRQKEEEELQMALKLSIQDKATQAQAKSSQQPTSAAGPSQTQPAPQQQPLPSGTTAATVSRVRALFDFQATDPDELTFRKGDIIAVLESVYKDWWKGLLRGQTGIFPLNYVEKLADPTPEELQREAQMEAEVFAEIKNVEKLLTLLSTSTSELNVRDNEEITKLYHSTLAIRPKLIELIGKYSQRKGLHLINTGVRDKAMAGAIHHKRAPPQQDPQRYYTPVPQEQPYPQQPSSPQGYPPQPHRNGPAPFYVVAPQQQQPPSEPPAHQQYPQRDPTPRIPSSSKPAPLQTSSPLPPLSTRLNSHKLVIAPRALTSNPQELATSVYDSPVNQQNPNSAYSASVYSPEEQFPPTGLANQQPPPSQQQYNAYVPPPLQTQAPPQSHPSYDPPAPPGNAPPPVPSNAGYPVLGQAYDARNTLPSQGAGQYKAYQRPGSSEGPNLSTPSAPPGGPADFYRQSAAY